MEWRDDGLIIGVKRHGESSIILELMTALHGRHLGLVRGGRSRRMQPILQPGNSVEAVWRARIDEHLGMLSIEGTRLRSAQLMSRQSALHGLALVGLLLRLLAEREVHQTLYDMALHICEHLHERGACAQPMVLFELAVLRELGFGLDLTQCAATGTRDDLDYISPKTGRAVSRGAGLPYHDRLLKLPGFLSREDATGATTLEITEGFAATGYFLARHLFEPRGIEMPPVRIRYVELVTAPEPAEGASEALTSQ